jgi:hypothetical protein
MSLEIKLGNKPIRSGRPAKILQRKILWILLASLSAMAFLLAPAPYMFVLNHEQKQCAQFWPGDEYVYYRLPEPWQEAGPDSNGLIQTPFGSCNLHKVDDGTISYETCCQKLGYTYISEIKGIVEKRDYGLIFGQIISYIIFYLGIPCGIPIAALLLYFFAVKRSIDKQNATGE